MLSSKLQRRLPPLHALRAFEAAARHLSFKEAARELAVSPTAISHHVRLLESTLRVKLFERRPRQIELTAEGKDLYPVLRSGFDSFAQAVVRLKSRRVRTIVTLSATVAFTARWLVPRAPLFHRDNSRMDLKLHASDDPIDLSSDVADAAIRYGRGEYPRLKSEKLFEDSFAPVCSPRLRVREVTDLTKHTLIHFEWRRPHRDNPTWSRWLQEAGCARLSAKADLILTDESQAIQAAVAGHGVALLSSILIGDELARGDLVRPLEPTLPGFNYSLVYPPESEHSEPIAVLRAWINKGLTQETERNFRPASRV